MALRVSQLKPNPAGKDRGRFGPLSAAQLGAEWVDIKNVGTAPVGLGGIELYHLAYGRPGTQPEWQKVTSFTGSLRVGEVLRVHSGQTRDLSVLHREDLVGADYHGFSGRDAYVWNNAEGDTAGLWEPQSKTWVDKGSYDPHPPEGVVLVRSGSKLVPAGAALRV
jgi:hypothetical protein